MPFGDDDGPAWRPHMPLVPTWILDDTKTPVPCHDFARWALWMADETNIRVAETTLPDGVWVSTVFLGWNFNHFGDEPITFETAVFRSKVGLIAGPVRYATWADAEAGHQAVVADMSNAD